LAKVTNTDNKQPAKIGAKDGAANITLNIVIFLLAVIILYLVYSIVIKVGGSEPATKNESEAAAEIIQIEVLNGCGIAGVGDRFTDFLRNNKFDVVNVGNYSSFDMNNTIVIDRIGNKANAEKTALLLGVKKEHVMQQINTDYFVDVSVIIGKDCNVLNPLK